MKKHVRRLKKLLFIALLLAGRPVTSQIFINEIMINPSGPNDGSNMPNTAEWIEFYNGSGSSVDISCWFFTDGDFAVTFPSGTSISAGGYYTVASTAGSGLTPNLNWATCGCTSGPASEVGIFTNGAEQVILYNSSGTIIDAIIWSTGQLPDGMTTSVVGSCGSRTVSFPTSASGAYESIGSNSDGQSKERATDGSATWQNTSTPTFGSPNSVVLPIELVEFKADLKNNVVELTWVTATEINNDRFVIERSQNGIDFESVLTIVGAGNSNEFKKYNLFDEKPIQGLSYYRLKQIDYDGSFSYSDLQSVDVTMNVDFNIFPNPSEDGKYEIVTNTNELSEIKIYSATGQLILHINSKDEKTLINIQNFEQGVYFLTIITAGGTFTKKLIYN